MGKDLQTSQGSSVPNPSQLADVVGENLPFLRRYARALTGSQETGDTYASATLEALIEDASIFDDSVSGKAALFRAFHLIWSSAGSPVSDGDDAMSRRAQGHMAQLTPNSREALLLHTIEEFPLGEIAVIMQVSEPEARDLLDRARAEMEDSVTGRILIIEDEAIIAMDIEGIVTSMGHAVTGIARTRARAVELGRNDRPDLILADIQLADDSSGIDAVNELLQSFPETPVIFITAFPERLLTGDRPEPAFLISKPYTEEQVRSAVSQAMFFASTEGLGG
ncbi:response regulator [Rhodovulum sp. 12E13]|uniref:response regulator n=1 Tax=Rhodovulum sp. 12E13 TaxID=2203891 RepID=UPI000E11FB4F|nr:response regulator [Rhodovulum sp. 12E13]